MNIMNTTLMHLLPIWTKSFCHVLAYIFIMSYMSTKDSKLQLKHYTYRLHCTRITTKTFVHIKFNKNYYQ